MKLSIIVPVYNAQNTLNACIKSIISQHYTDWELILVNDGSIDSSLSICNEYANSDSRIKIINKANGGVSSARNIGLEYAIGEWVTFIDADDYISQDYFNIIESARTDLVVLKNCHFLPGEMPFIYERIDDCSINGVDVSEFFSKYLHYHVFMVPWGKFFRKDLIAGQRFLLEQRLGEDVIFVQQYLKKCNSLMVFNGASYFYLQDSSYKYTMTINDALVHLRNIYNNYKQTGIESPDFCLFELSLFTRLANHEINMSPLSWYRNRVVNEVYNECKKLYSWKERVKINLYRIPMMYSVINCIK